MTGLRLSNPAIPTRRIYMKKAIVLLLALAVLGGAVFAQATFNGYVRATGTINDDGTFAYADRIRLNLGWTSEDKMVKFGARYQGTSAAALPDPTYLYGQIKLMDGMLAISGGELWNYDYDIYSGISEYYNGNVGNTGAYTTEGMLIQVMPMDALSLGLGLHPDSMDLGLGQMSVFAKYDLTDLGALVVSANFAEETADSVISATFQFTGVENLGVAAGYVMDPTESYAFGIIDYAMDALTLQTSPMYKLDSSALYIEASVQYDVSDSIALLAHVSYEEDVAGAVEVLYKVGKGLLQANVAMAEDGTISVPLIVKVSF
jgi:hypothetical protein